MKKLFYVLGLMFVTLTLSNCAKNEVDVILPEDKPNFHIVAKTDNMTRTTLDATNYTIAWTDSDQLNVFYRQTSSSDAYSKATFTASATNYAGGNFDGTVTLTPEHNYDWYVMYPYNSYVTSCDGSTGSFKLGNQTQTGNNSTAHIGAADVMVGKHINTLSPNIALSHLGVLHKFTITNTESSDITIKSIKIDGGSVTVGGHYPINFTLDTPSLLTTTPSPAWTTTTLTVSSGSAIANGASAAFYMILPPFTIAKDNSLIFTVTDSNDKVCTLTKTVSAEGGLTFEAGKSYNANLDFAFDPVVTVSGTSVELANTAASTATFTVTSDTDWTASKSGSGYTFTPSSGTASSDPVTITVTASNAGGSSLAELGAITIIAGNTSKSVTVKQAGSAAATVIWEDDFSTITAGSTTALSSLLGSKSGFSGSYSELANVYPNNDNATGGSLKLGSSGKKGTITTPKLTNVVGTQNLRVTFKASYWNGTSESKTLTITVNGGGMSSTSTITLANMATTNTVNGGNSDANFGECEFTITGATPTTTITIAATNASKNRFYFDDLKITTN